MPKLPRVSGATIIKALKQAGYFQVRQQGSHVRLAHRERAPTTVPLHDVIGPGLLRKILRDTEMTPEEFLALL
jgi:predicted RNA binding protein YcfA (HicA-like mRNA interferase family)